MYFPVTLLKSFKTYLPEKHHQHLTSHASRDKVKTGLYRIISVKHQASSRWNHLQNQLNSDMLP